MCSTQDFRDGSLRAGLNELLRRIEFSCGLSYGIISDPGQREMTATEIVSAKQRLFSTVKEIQNTLERALEELLNIMNYWADFLPGVPAGGYRTDYRWDDSIVTDHHSGKSAVFAGNRRRCAPAMGISGAFSGGNERTGQSGVHCRNFPDKRWSGQLRDGAVRKPSGG